MTTDLLPLRQYQREAIDAVFRAHDDGMRFPVVVLPTGSGKTVVFAHMIREFAQRHGTRALVLVHRDELAAQAMDKIRSVAPHLGVGLVKAADNEVGADVVVASVQTLSRAQRMRHVLAKQPQYGEFGLLITDEVHHGAAASYRSIYDAFPGARKVGVTATLARGDGVGLGSVVDDVVFSRSVLWMISKGYLADVRGQAVTAGALDLGSVRSSGGDYAAGALGDAMMSADVPGLIAASLEQYAADRRSIVFTPTVATAHAVVERLGARGIVAEAVSGQTPVEDRRRTYEGFRTGRTRALVNCAVLVEGFDAPWADCVVPKPTRSEGSYQQQVGRVLRPWEGKADALVLDVMGSGDGNRLRTLVDLEPGSVKEVRKGETLTEAVLREAEESEALVTSGSPVFALRNRDMDLFAASRSVWLRTPAGVQFVPAGEDMVMLWPSAEPGLWDVCCAPKGLKWERLHTGLPLEMAMSWGEAEAEDRGGTIGRRDAAWRRRKQPPSPAQAGLCRQLGVAVPDGATKNEVSDLISVAIGTRTFDRFVRSTV